MKKISIILAAALTLAACHKNAISEPSLSEVDLYATIGDETSTKTVMDENNNIRWSERDQIVAFMKSSLSMKYQLAEDNDITFKNVLGGIKLQLCGTQKVKSIKLDGSNNEKLSAASR